MTSRPTDLTLTERYIAVAVQSLPEQQRADVSRELRAAIMDAMDARLAQGRGQAHDTASAEAAVLTEMGDPERLAASYTDRKLYLIGPDVFLTYWRVLKQLLIIIVPILTGLVFLAHLADGNSGLSAIGEAAGSVITIALHIVFWTTLVFVIIDRYDPDEVRRMRTWSLDKLPDTAPRQISLGDILSGIALSIVAIALIVLQTRRSFVTDNGEHVPVLNPDLWSFWLPAIIVVLLIGIVLEIAKYRSGHWTMPLAISNLLVNAALAVPLVWLAFSERLINPEVFTVLDWPEGAGSDGVLAITVAVSVLAICIWDAVEGLYHALRNSGRHQSASRT